MKNFRFFAISLATSLTLLSCSGKLSRGKAAELIKSSSKFQKSESADIPNCYKLDKSGIANYNPLARNFYDDYAKDNLTTIMQSINTSDGTFVFYGFTPEGEKYTTSIAPEQNGLVHYVKVCDIELDEVTGIQINEQTNSATVEYSVKRTNWTPFAWFFKEKFPLKYQNSPPSRIAFFRKYDDGWRMTGDSQKKTN